MKPRDRYDSLLQFYTEGTSIPWQWAKAQMLAESNANPDARSSAGAVGLMQFLESTWLDVMGPMHDRRDAESSIQAYSVYMPRIMAYLRDDDLERATAAYNCGMGNVRNWGESWRYHIPTETVQYLRRIKNLYAELLAEQPTMEVATCSEPSSTC